MGHLVLIHARICSGFKLRGIPSRYQFIKTWTISFYLHILQLWDILSRTIEDYCSNGVHICLMTNRVFFFWKKYKGIRMYTLNCSKQSCIINHASKILLMPSKYIATTMMVWWILLVVCVLMYFSSG